MVRSNDGRVCRLVVHRYTNSVYCSDTHNHPIKNQILHQTSSPPSQQQ